MTPDQQLAAAGIVLSTVIGGCALIIAIYTARRANNNQSAANFLTLSEALRENFLRFQKPDSSDEYRHLELTNLLNLLEAASATLLDHAIHGRASELLRKLVCDLMNAILNNDQMRAFIAGRRKTPETFENISDFVELMRRQGKARELWKFVQPDGSFDPNI